MYPNSVSRRGDTDYFFLEQVVNRFIAFKCGRVKICKTRKVMKERPYRGIAKSVVVPVECSFLEEEWLNPVGERHFSRRMIFLPVLFSKVSRTDPNCLSELGFT